MGALFVRNGSKLGLNLTDLPAEAANFVFLQSSSHLLWENEKFLAFRVAAFGGSMENVDIDVDRTSRFLPIPFCLTAFRMHIKNSVLLAVLACLSFLAACKYPDGPLVSLHSKEARIRNTWEPEFSFLNGDSATYDSPSGNRYFQFSPTLSCRSITFWKDGTSTIVFFYNSAESNTSGTWELSEDASTILFDFSLGYPESLEWEIQHLGNNRLSVEFDYRGYHVEVTLRSA